MNVIQCGKKALFFLSLLVFVGCGGGAGGSGGTEYQEFTVKEVKLSISAPQTMTVNEGEKVTIKATGRASGANPKLSYSWLTVFASLLPDLQGTNTDTITFTAPMVSSNRDLIFLVQLDAEGVIYTDILAGKPTARVVVTVVDTSPRANAGSDQTGIPGNLVTLSSQSTNTDSCAWEQTSGATLVITNPNQCTAQVTLPDLSAENTFTFQLTATSTSGQTDTDLITLTVVQPTPPTAVAGNDQSAPPFGTVLLQGAANMGSSPIQSYNWQQISGEKLEIIHQSYSQMQVRLPETYSQQTYVFELTVTDNRGLFHSDQVTVTMSPPVSPKAVLNASLTYVLTGNNVQLDGSGSTDDLGITHYYWSQTQGTPISGISASEPILSFNAPTVTSVETLSFQLRVVDASGLEDAATVDITVYPSNAAPVAVATAPTTADERTRVTLTGSGSSDVDNNIVSYQWSQLSGPDVNIRNSNSSDANVSIDNLSEDTQFRFQLTVSDLFGETDTATVSITIQNKNQLPVIGTIYGINSVYSGTQRSIIASFHDPDGLTRQSYITQLTGPEIWLARVNPQEWKFIAPETDVQQNLSFRLTVIGDTNEIVTKDFSIDILPLSSTSTQITIHEPNHGQVVLGDDLIANGSITQDGLGASLPILASIWRSDSNSVSSTSDAQGLWQLSYSGLGYSDRRHVEEVRALKVSYNTHDSDVVFFKNLPQTNQQAEVITGSCESKFYIMYSDNTLVERHCDQYTRALISSAITDPSLPGYLYSAAQFASIDPQTGNVIASDGKNIIRINTTTGERSTIYQSASYDPIFADEMSIASDAKSAIVKRHTTPGKTTGEFSHINFESGKITLLENVNKIIKGNSFDPTGSFYYDQTSSKIYFLSYSNLYEINFETGVYRPTSGVIELDFIKQILLAANEPETESYSYDWQNKTIYLLKEAENTAIVKRFAEWNGVNMLEFELVNDSPYQPAQVQ
ncbi:PKD domain-containing protein [Teredinibacter sp. KSP-S5-2]|uniref:PKD domain-containing protein n=1 Tax=Teredinibacter sp. KSP-S5-2 TaxID=3034506 RepID=UPI0029341E22|nr:hypothetical protein [Teredinibacter sp. KSP-S5-2]WNO07948.1 hypothetical protein P5V12_13270 [Teredinibacter sp. KSP-S5-2]